MKRGWLIILIASILGSLLLSCRQKESGSSKGCQNIFSGEEGEVKLIVLAPGHFHAGLLQKVDIPQVNDSVSVYALSTDNAGLKQYLSAIESYNSRDENPTSWEEIVYTGDDFLQKMRSDKNGNVVILAGNNRDKTKYILAAVDAGLNVLSDKPMAINPDDFLMLESAYQKAESENLLLYDLMTERYDLLNIIEKELINAPDFFGTLETGSVEEPAIYMESLHHFYKEVSAVPLIRPAWYYDVEQQGEGIADVTTHLIDLIFWKCFPEESIDYNSDISNISATRWPTEISLEEFSRSTGEESFPDYLQKDLVNSILNVYANGTLNFNVKGINATLKVVWNYQAPKGGGDRFSSVIKGSKAILKTEQSSEQNFVKQLYVQNPGSIANSEFETNLQKIITKITVDYPFVSASPTTNRGEYIINIPVEYREGHESHFSYVANKFFSSLVSGEMAEWEKANTLTKYYITTEAISKANETR